jgi:hypothetical protein
MIGMSPQEIARILGGDAHGNSIRCPGPGHSPADRSMSITLASSAPQGFLVHSFAGDDGIACKAYVRDKLGINDGPTTGGSKDSGISYVYKQQDGTPYLRVKRTSDKKFYQQHLNGTGWENGAPKGPKIPYRLPELLAAEHDTVIICEGEKDADNLVKLGFTATTNAGGAGKWTPELSQWFKGRDIFILPDNDDPGEKHGKQVAEALAGIAREVRIVRLPGLPPKGDVSNWIAAGGTADELARLLNEAPIDAQPIAPLVPKLIVSSGAFVAGFVPPDYLVDGLLQRRFCYSLTAPTGSGKTAIALLLAAYIALGRAVGEYGVERGRVLYLAGENPDDVRMRWLAMAKALGFDVNAIDAHFLPGVFKLTEIGARIAAEVAEIGEVALVIVDTSAAYYEGDDENHNVQMGMHARRMRALVNLPGKPCVLVACHPVKNATVDNLLPRGGGSFVAEMDGNLTATKNDNAVTLHWQGKFRGPDFAPVAFQLVTATTEKVRDSKGRTIPTVIAKAMTEGERNAAEAATRSDEDALLIAIADHDRASMSGLADVLRWINRKGKSDKSRVQRCANRLKADKLVKPERGGTLALTEKGKAEAIRAKQNSALAGARYG